MERLPFVLPDFTRLLWVSDAAREVWEPRLQRVTSAWLEVEWRAIVAGVRQCAITSLAPESLVGEAATWLDQGLFALPLEMQGVAQVYASTAVAHTPGQPFVYRAVVGHADDVRAFRAAWLAADDETIGRLLGYPSCCTAFFRRVWVDDRMVDTTWPMALASTGETNGARSLTVAGPAAANILWRWMGARAVPHLPCRVDCEKTVSLAERLVEVGWTSGHGAEMDWLLEILSWPAEWSALHGIAEVKTPVLKVSTRTDATPTKYVVRREGTDYPAEGARGLAFPYRVPARARLTGSPSFRRGLSQVLPVAAPQPPEYATDNGFPSAVAMDLAHAPILALASTILDQQAGDVLDLGCGNGALLGKLRAAHPGLVPFGIDMDPGRITRAREQFPQFAMNFWTGNLFDSNAPWKEGRRYAAALLMPGRLLETDPASAAQLRDRLRSGCDRLLVYAYGDWLTRHGSFEQLVEAAGLRLQRAEGPVGLAEIP